MIHFWSQVKKSVACWVWQAGRTNGYGWYKGKYAHRIAYELSKGTIPDGLTIDHLCRNTLCVNPLHLEAVTRGENANRGNGACGLNKRKTHCKHGHEFTEDNIYYKGPARHRICKTCSSIRCAEYYRRNL